MNFINRLMISGASVALGTTLALSSVPAVAQKSAPKAEKAASAQLSKEFKAAAGPAQAALQQAQALNEEAKKLQAAGNAAGATAKKAEAKAAYAAARPLVEAMVPVAKSPDELSFTGEFQLQVAMNTDDKKGQEAALDRIISSGKGNASNLAAYHYFSGAFAYEGGNYPKAIQRLGQAKTLGYTGGELDPLLMDSYLKGGQPEKGVEMARAAIAARKASGQAMSEDLFTRPAIALQKAGKKPELMEFVIGRVQYFTSKEYWANAISMAGQQTTAPDAKLDLLRLKSIAGVMEDEYDYVSYSYFTAEEGLPNESLAAITEGRAKVKFGTASSAELKTREALQRTRLATDTKASLTSSESSARSGANGRIAKATGDAWLSYNEYDKAIAMYQLALQKGGVDADLLNSRIGIALAKKGDKAGAKASFAKVGGTRTTVAKLWSTYLDVGVKG